MAGQVDDLLNRVSGVLGRLRNEGENDEKTADTDWDIPTRDPYKLCFEGDYSSVTELHKEKFKLFTEKHKTLLGPYKYHRPKNAMKKVLLGDWIFKLPQLPNNRLEEFPVLETLEDREEFSKLIAECWESLPIQRTTNIPREVRNRETGQGVHRSRIHTDTVGSPLAPTSVTESAKKIVEHQYEVREYVRAKGGSSNEYSIVYMQLKHDRSDRYRADIDAGIFLLKLPPCLPPIVQNMLRSLLFADVPTVDQPWFDFTNRQREGSCMPGYRLEYEYDLFSYQMQELCNACLTQTQFSTRICARDSVFEMIKIAFGTGEEWAELHNTTGDLKLVRKIFKKFRPAHPHEYDSEEDEIADSIDNTSGDGLEEEEHENMENSHGLGKIDGKHYVIRMFLLRDKGNDLPKFAVLMQYYITPGRGRRMFLVETYREADQSPDPGTLPWSQIPQPTTERRRHARRKKV